MTLVFKHCNNKLFKNMTNRKVLISKGHGTSNYSSSLYFLHHKGVQEDGLYPYSLNHYLRQNTFHVYIFPINEMSNILRLPEADFLKCCRFYFLNSPFVTNSGTLKYLCILSSPPHLFQQFCPRFSLWKTSFTVTL